MPFGSPAGQPANEAEECDALTKAKECDALRESLRKIADDFVAAPTEGAGVVDRRNLCGRYYTLAAAADAACGLRRASLDLPRLAWTDAFTGHEQPPTSSWGYELACTLFNLAASLADLGAKSGNARAALLAATLEDAVGRLLAQNQSPSRKVRELDNRGSHFYIALYWAEAVAQRDAAFKPLAQALAAAKEATLKELIDCQGAKVDIGGYWLLDDAKANKAMRPSAAFNKLIDSL
jgi:hypothetical protein